MAFDAPRKTLDEIRRELEEEFGGAAAGDTPSAPAASDHEAAASDPDAAASDLDDPDHPLVNEADADARSVPRPPTNAGARRMSNVSRVSDVIEPAEIDIVQ